MTTPGGVGAGEVGWGERVIPEGRVAALGVVGALRGGGTGETGEVVVDSSSWLRDLVGL